MTPTREAIALAQDILILASYEKDAELVALINNDANIEHTLFAMTSLLLSVLDLMAEVSEGDTTRERLVQMCGELSLMALSKMEN